MTLQKQVERAGYVKKADKVIVLFAYDSPEYLTRTVKSLRALEGYEDYDLVVSVDGTTSESHGPEISRIREVLGVVNSIQHPNKYVLQWPRNQGVGRVTWEMYNLVFGLGYDLAVLVEDDVEAAPSSLQILDLLREENPSPALLGLYTPCVWKRRTKGKKLAQMREGLEFVFFSLDAVAWEIVKPVWWEYTEKFIVPLRRYCARDHTAIRAWFSEQLGRDVGMMETSRDGAIRMACEKLGVTAKSTLVNHVAHFGEVGEHMTPSLFKALKHDVTALDIFTLKQVKKAIRGTV